MRGASTAGSTLRFDSHGLTRFMTAFYTNKINMSIFPRYWPGKRQRQIDIAAKRHKIHKNNNLHIGISNSYGRQKYKFVDFLQDHQA